MYLDAALEDLERMIWQLRFPAGRPGPMLYDRKRFGAFQGSRVAVKIQLRLARGAATTRGPACFPGHQLFSTLA